MRNAFALDGRTVLVTGAASGIGAETARVCAALGASVRLVDRAPTEPLAQEIRQGGGTASSHLVDMADRSQVEELAEAIGPIDALVLSAAICPFGEDWTDPDWDASFDRVIGVNVHGPLNAARAFLPGMIARRNGRIVLVGSLAGRAGGLIAGPHYVASKGAVHAFAKWLAKRGAPHGVIVNAVAPASIETPMMTDQPVDVDAIPVGRRGTPQEVAWPIAFLCSDAASYVCGTVLDVNGGVWMN